MPAKVVWNPPAVQLALWKSYLDKNKGSIRKAHSQIPDPKPSYIAFMKICNTAIKANNMNGDEFKGFVKGLLTGFELK